jgi:hypothetical protein
MNFLTFVIAGTGLVGIILVIQGGEDTKRLVKAAQDQSAAAQQFSTSAAQISAGIQDAVAKLKVQGDADNAMAFAANTANSNSLEADRPWIGAYLSVADFAAAKTPSYTVSFINSGKRPARITRVQTMSAFRSDGDHPVYPPFDATPSVSITVPGQAFVSTWTEIDPHLNPMTSEVMDRVMLTTDAAIPVRVYAKVEYEDVRTAKNYWTHVCWRFMPSYVKINGGFTSCSEYNDAK